MKNNKRAEKIILSAVVLIIMVVLGLIYFNIEINKELEETAKSTLFDSTEQQKNAFNKEIEKEENNLASIATAIATFGYEGEETWDYINRVKKQFSFETVAIVAIDGQGVTSDGALVNLSDAEYFKKALKGSVYSSEPHSSEISQGEVVAVSAPIYFQERIQGVIIAEYTIDYLNEILEAISIDHGYALVVNEESEILFNTSQINTNELRAEDTEYVDGEKEEEIERDLLNGESGIAKVVVNYIPTRIVYIPLGYNGWSLIYAVPEDVIMKDAREISERMILLSIVIVFACFGVGFYIINSDRKTMNELEHIAYYDELTGVRNLTKFKIDVKGLLESNPDKRYISVKADLINFKAINELYNFEIGNKVIKTIANAWGKVDEPSFILARIDADEFIMVAENHFFSDIERTAEAYEGVFRNMIVDLEHHQFQFRFGRYFIEPTETDVDVIINKTNIAHRFAKSEASIVHWDYDKKYKDHLVRTTEITNKMKAALYNRNYKVYLQPKNDVSTGEMIGAEALVRWIEDDGNMIFPNDFIPLFEKNGFITVLDQYMLEQVCQILERWKKENKKCIPISVNFSRLNFKNEYFVSDINEAINKYDIEPRFIEVELTETGITQYEGELIQLIDNLHKIGVVVSIDDFGAGYSSLGMLKKYKVDILKLDKSFFDELEDDYRGKAIVENIINLAHELKIRTVAEGIETADQLEFLRNAKCKYAQGYFFAKPMPVELFEETYCK